MALPTCPKCDSRVFRLTEFEPLESKFKLNAVHCSSCGAVVAVLDYYNTGAMLDKIMKRLGIR